MHPLIQDTDILMHINLEYDINYITVLIIT